MFIDKDLVENISYKSVSHSKYSNVIFNSISVGVLVNEKQTYRNLLFNYF